MANNCDQLYDGKVEFGYSWLSGAYPEGFAPVSCVVSVCNATSPAILKMVERGEIRAIRKMVGRELVVFVEWQKALTIYTPKPMKVKALTVPASGEQGTEYIEMLCPEARKGLDELSRRQIS